MSAQLRFKSFLATLVVLFGSVLVLVCFFQPWVEASLLVKTIKLSGLDLANKSAMILLVPLLAAATGILMSLFLLKNQLPYRIFALIFSLLGLILVILIFVQMSREIANWVAKITRFQYKPGIIGVLCGFLIQLIGTLLERFRPTSAGTVSDRH